MCRIPLITLFVAGVGLFSVSLGFAQASVDKETRRQLDQLGPEGLVAPPKNLSDLVRNAQAAVSAEIVGFGDDVTFIPRSTRGGAFLGTEAFAAYRVVIRAVLFNREPGAPPLPIGPEVDFTQLVGREQAEAFIAKRLPVATGDQCLLFLWHRAGGDSWSILQWPLQFRRSAKMPDAAEAVLARRWLDANWLGSSMPVAAHGETVAVDWAALVQEVKRLSMQKTEKQKSGRPISRRQDPVVHHFAIHRHNPDLAFPFL